MGWLWLVRLLVVGAIGTAIGGGLEPSLAGQNAPEDAAGVELAFSIGGAQITGNEAFPAWKFDGEMAVRTSLSLIPPDQDLRHLRIQIVVSRVEFSSPGGGFAQLWSEYGSLMELGPVQQEVWLVVPRLEGIVGCKEDRIRGRVAVGYGARHTTRIRYGDLDLDLGVREPATVDHDWDPTFVLGAGFDLAVATSTWLSVDWEMGFGESPEYPSERAKDTVGYVYLGLARRFR